MTGQAGTRDDWTAGELAWFEHRGYDSPSSASAELWHRSHQCVTVLGRSEHSASWCPMYTVQFPDGYIGDAYDDELLTDPGYYVRPDPDAHGSWEE